MLRRLLAVVALAIPTAAPAQSTLVCPAPVVPPAKACDTFHFHVAMFRPDSRTLVELSSINQFASQSACDGARDAAMRRNAAIVDYFRRVKGDDRYEADRFGPCHCDLTPESARVPQSRAAAEIRLRVRERLMNSGLTTDNDLVRLMAPASSSPLRGPKRLPLPPPAAAVQASNDPADLRDTHAIASSAPATAAFDLPLVDLSGGAAMPPALVASMTPQGQQQEVTIATKPDGTKVITNQPVAATETPAPQPAAPVDAGAFMSYEFQRVRNVVEASAALTDESMKQRIFEACTQRTTLLSNLRTLIEGSGANSRLAAAVRAAEGEPQRLAFIARLFGSDMPPHWAPKDASNVLLEAPTDDPEKVLRDTTGRFGGTAKRRALYDFLARNQVTEQQEAWLQSVIEALLQ